MTRIQLAKMVGPSGVCAVRLAVPGTEKGRRTFAVEKWAAQMVIRGCELLEE